MKKIYSNENMIRLEYLKNIYRYCTIIHESLIKMPELC